MGVPEENRAPVIFFPRMKNFRKIAWILAGYAASFIATLAAFAFASQPANF